MCYKDPDDGAVNQQLQVHSTSNLNLTHSQQINLSDQLLIPIMNSDSSSMSSSSNLMASYKPKQKDYQAAFGELQSQYGFGGAAPVQPSRLTQSSSYPSSKSKNSRNSSQGPSPTQPKPSSSNPPSKNWEASLANLQSSWFRWGCPLPSGI